VNGSVNVYIEGGTYTFEDGDWWLDLVASSVGQGRSAAWVEIPAAWRWTDFQNLAWVDLIGVGAPSNRTETT
jgi:hypothetical protein